MLPGCMNERADHRAPHVAGMRRDSALQRGLMCLSLGDDVAARLPCRCLANVLWLREEFAEH